MSGTSPTGPCFDESFDGYGYLENLDFSYSVGRTAEAGGAGGRGFLPLSLPVRPEQHGPLRQGRGCQQAVLRPQAWPVAVALLPGPSDTAADNAGGGVFAAVAAEPRPGLGQLHRPTSVDHSPAGQRLVVRAERAFMPSRSTGAVRLTRRLKILISAYACNPYKGSEEGVGWGWVTAIARRGEY